MAGELTPMMVELRTMYREARERQHEALETWQQYQRTADELEDKRNRLYYGTVLRTTGNPQTKKAEAELATADLRLQWTSAKTLAEAAEKAHRGHTKALGAIEAMGHAYNRELKTLGG